MLNIFSCVCWTSVCLLLRIVCLDFYPFFHWFVFLILSCMRCLYILDINPLSVFSFTVSLTVLDILCPLLLRKHIINKNYGRYLLIIKLQNRVGGSHWLTQLKIVQKRKNKSITKVFHVIELLTAHNSLL